MTSHTLTVISSGLSQPSSSRLLGGQLANATRQALQERTADTDTDPNPDIEIVELREHAHDVVNALLTGVATGSLRDVIDRVSRSDGVIAVSPIFNASYNGLFKTFFDVLDPDALTGMPVLAAGTGGTPRHSLALEHALRPMFAYLRAVVVPTAVFAAAEDWGSGGDGATALTERVTRAASEFAALLAKGGPARPSDAFEEPIPFEQLLNGTRNSS